METRESNQTGEVGEEAVGPLTLSRPEGGWWSLWPIFVYTALFAYVEDDLQRFAELQLGFEKELASHSVATLKVGMMLLLAFALQQLMRRHTEKIRISRGTLPTIAADEVFEIWNERFRVIPSVPLIISTAFGAVGVCFLWYSVYGLDRAVGILLIAGSMYYGINFWRDGYHPLLKASPEILEIRGRAIDWKNVQSVDVLHAPYLGGSMSIQLVVFDKNRRLLGRVSLPPESFSMAQESDLLTFIAKILGRRVNPVADDDQYWI